MKIDVPLEYNKPLENMIRIRNVILACGTTPKAVFAWMYHSRPLAVFDADLQKIFAIVDAAMSVLPPSVRFGACVKQFVTPPGPADYGYDFHAALDRVNTICKSRIGEVN